MEQRAAVRPGLPRRNPTVSYWQNPPSPLANHRTTSELPATADIVVVGSGITGASIAFNLLERSSQLSVLMLEARTACSGATGRNGGHTKHASYREFVDNCKSEGSLEASKIARLEYDCMKAVHAFARTHSIECDSLEGDTVDVFYDEGQMLKARKAVAEMKRVLGENDPVAAYTFWSADETRSRFLAEGSLGAVSYAAGSLSAYRFAIGILRLALEKGLNLQCGTSAMEIAQSDRNGFSWMVQTPRGTVHTQKLVLATNGYTARLLSTVQGIIVPLRGHMTAQRPGTSLPKSGLSTTYSFIYDDGYEYMTTRPQGSKYAGDIMIGGGLTKASSAGLEEFGTTDDTTLNPRILDYLKRITQVYFGSNWGEDDPEGRLRNTWTGIMGYSADGFPLIGGIPGSENLYIAASFQGSGMVLSLLCAQALVQMILKTHEDELDAWFPKAFRMGQSRLKHKFTGRLHATVAMDLEVKAQL